MPAVSEEERTVLQENEQLVLKIRARSFPSLSGTIWIVMLQPFWILLPLLILHRIFRKEWYLITTRRVILCDTGGIVDDIDLATITGMKGTKVSLMISGRGKKLWLSRLPDAWFFENVINNVLRKTTVQVNAVNR